MRRYLVPFLCLLSLGAATAAGSNEQLQSLVQQKRYQQAIDSGEQILRQRPADAQARFLTAYAYQMAGRTDEASALYQALIRDEPSLPEPRNNLAMIFLAAGDYDNASRLLVEAINTHSSYATAYDNLSRVYKGIASEAYRRAVSESSEPAKYTHDIRLDAIASLDSLDLVNQPPPRVATLTVPPPAAETAASSSAGATPPAVAETAAPSAIDTANRETRLIEIVRDWAGAWSDKAFADYIAAYADGYRARFDSREQWVEHRRGRIVRPGEIKVEVSDFKVKLRGEDRASVDFAQAYSSPGYSDRVVKRLDFRRSGNEWKIISERTLSVL